MAAPLLRRLHDRRLEITQETARSFLEGLRQNGTPRAPERRDLGDLIHDCLSYPEVLKQICESSFQAIHDGAILDTNREGRELEEIFERTLGFMREVRDIAARFDTENVPAVPFERLHQIITETEQWHQRLFANWPWSNQTEPPFDPRMADAARADYQRGDWQDMEEVIRELQGSHPQTH
jgi:hypothetical protein